jgi:hypothetical protein
MVRRFSLAVLMSALLAMTTHAAETAQCQVPAASTPATWAPAACDAKPAKKAPKASVKKKSTRTAVTVLRMKSRTDRGQVYDPTEPLPTTDLR